MSRSIAFILPFAAAIGCAQVLGIDAAAKPEPSVATPDASVASAVEDGGASPADTAAVCRAGHCAATTIAARLSAVIDVAQTDTHVALATAAGVLYCALPACAAPVFVPAVISPEPSSPKVALSSTHLAFIDSAMPEVHPLRTCALDDCLGTVATIANHAYLSGRVANEIVYTTSADGDVSRVAAPSRLSATPLRVGVGAMIGAGPEGIYFHDVLRNVLRCPFSATAPCTTLVEHAEEAVLRGGVLVWRSIQAVPGDARLSQQLWSRCEAKSCPDTRAVVFTTRDQNEGYQPASSHNGTSLFVLDRQRGQAWTCRMDDCDKTRFVLQDQLPRVETQAFIAGTHAYVLHDGRLDRFGALP